MPVLPAVPLTSTLQPVRSEGPRSRMSGVLPIAPVKPSRICTLWPQKVEQQPVDALRLLLLHPVASALDEVTAAQVGAGLRLHTLEIARLLVDAPVGRAGDEHRRDVDGAARERKQPGNLVGAGAAAVPLQPALEAGALERLRIFGELRVGEPRRRARRHYGRYRFGHVFAQLH